MENENKLKLGVGEFIALMNQTLEYAFPSVEVEGEVASFKVNQGKYVFFDLKDESGSIGCFMTVWQLRVPVEDGMKVIVSASPKLTQWGKFSLTVRTIRPSGEGAIKKSFEILKAKLTGEGLFAAERKRPLPTIPQTVGVITSTQAAGYADFVKIVDDRWGGLDLQVAHVQVQGAGAPDQMIRALEYFNSRENLPDVIAIIRGGGSADDLAAFNDEPLVRAIAASRVPTLVGVGHEIDESLADLAADVRAATPSNAAQLLVPDKNEIIRSSRQRIISIIPKIEQVITERREVIDARLRMALGLLEHHLERRQEKVQATRQVLRELDPMKVLARGYALIRGTVSVGSTIEVETQEAVIAAEVLRYDKK